MQYKVEMSGTMIGMWEIYTKSWWQWKWQSTETFFSSAAHAALEVVRMRGHF